MRSVLIKLIPFILCVSAIAVLEQSFYVTPFVTLVHKQFYFVLRLERLIRIVNAISDTETILDLQDVHTNLFSHERIKKVAENLQRTRNLDELNYLWKDLIAYKFSSDHIFIEDLTRLLLILSKNILIEHIKKQKKYDLIHHVNKIFFEALHFSAARLLEVIDFFIDHYLKKNSNLDYGTQLTWPLIDDPYNVHLKDPDLELNVIPEFVSMRYYIVQRVILSIAHISKSSAKTELSIEQFGKILPSFSHKIVTTQLKKMIQKKSIEPFLELWDHFTQFRYIHDQELSRELCLIVALLLKVMLEQNQTGQKLTSTELQLWFQTIESLPIEDILDTLDLFTDQLPKILDKYELNSSLNWKQWLAKHWWSVPCIIGIITLRFVLLYKQLSNINQPARLL